MVFSAGEFFIFSLRFANLACALIFLGILAGIIAVFLFRELEKLRTPVRYLVPFLVAVLLSLFVPVFFTPPGPRPEAVTDAGEFFRCFIALMGAITAFWFFDSWIARNHREKYLGAGTMVTIFLVFLISSPELSGEPLSALPRWAVFGLPGFPDSLRIDWIYYSLDSLILFFKSLVFSVPAYAALLVWQTVMVYRNNRRAIR